MSNDMARKKDKAELLSLNRPVELVSMAPIATAMGVSPAAVRKFVADDPKFPEPYIVFPGGAARYDADAIRVWLRSGGESRANPVGRGRVFRPTVVYFIRCDVFVKIGYTQNVAARVAILKTGTPHELEVLRTTPGGVEEEGRLHTLFAEERVRPDGEWFRLSPRLQEYIAAIRSQGGV